MHRRVFFLFAIQCLWNCSAIAGAIFGMDDRASVLPSSSWSTYSRSTAVAVLSGNIEDLPNNLFNLRVDRLDDYLCPGERFRNEPSLSYACTGFLVAPNLLATAGHCMVNTGEIRNETKMYCEVFSWLFDYQKTASGTTQTQNISKDRLYRCKRIIFAVKDERAPFRDFALVELDRPVVGRTPFVINSKTLNSNQRLKMMGYPLGMPAQVATNAQILLDDPTRESFITNLDALEGNSGSPVLNNKNEVVGILQGGTPSGSFIDHPTRKCAEINKCSETGNNCKLPDTFPFPHFQRVGAEVQRIAPILDLIEDL